MDTKRTRHTTPESHFGGQGYFMTLYRRTEGWQINDELARIWKEAVVTESKCYPGVCLEQLRQI